MFLDAYHRAYMRIHVGLIGLTSAHPGSGHNGSPEDALSSRQFGRQPFKCDTLSELDNHIK